ncbi:shikimate kinase [Formosa maritima]|uniref:Shikimate kinase n=1 Tax=Formosa maritima TaxID=2592046 RepID=A0A5D0G3Q1_9FLAO|nr:shikimate kinase [Formosa maritima]TYA52507.1 shikimate kinase [Formosa maritima]
MKIILIGYMASGKSLIGNDLAHVLNVKFIDLDHYIENKEGKTIQKIFSEKGEIFFRKIENKYLNDILNSESSLVLSLGGGTPCFSNNLEIIKGCFKSKSIYLNVSVHELSKRLIVEKENRPLVKYVQTEEDMLEFVGKHLFERLPYYNQVDIIINGNNSKEEIIEEILLNLF